MGRVTKKRVREPARRGKAFEEKVFHATLTVLADAGFSALTIPAVAERAGVNKTSIYRRWPTRDELLGEALQTRMAAGVPAASSGNLRADLLALAKQSAAFVQSPLGKNSLRMLLAEGGRTEAGPWAAALAQSSPWPTTFFAQAKKRGELAPHADVPFAISVVAGTFMHRVLVEHAPLTPAFIERVVDLVLDGGLLAQPARRRR